MDGLPPTGHAGPSSTPTRYLPARRALARAGLRTTLTVAALLVLFYRLPLERDFSAGTVVALLGGLLAVGVLVGWQVRAVLRSPYPGLRAVEALALIVPLFLLLFAVVYVVLDGSVPGSFTEALSRTDALYLVVTVFTTVGFGDITPVTEVARILVTVQMVCNLVVLGLGFKAILDAVQRRRRG
ncbi:potassium channel family protein [Geodermatophilus ruber]|uniref:potassium channel family protein n=1 Tax=Geodermatophilus ruber TaxID=504800 RepID=UPI001C431FC5|nr:potassium channel family protein [Geodermatophilus ruber]